MHVVIAGDSSFAFSLAKRLAPACKHVVMIIEDKERAVEISAHAELLVIHGVATDPQVLDQVELEKVDVFVAATDKEEVNVMTALYAKNCGIRQVYVKVTNQSTANMLQKMDVVPVNASEYAALNVALYVTRPLVADLVDFSTGEYTFVQRESSKYPNLIGKALPTTFSEFFSIVGVYKDHQFHLSHNTQITENSVLVIICEKKRRKDLDDILKKLK